MRHSHRAVVASVAAGALALTGLAVAPVAATAAPTELFISEVIEGSSNNKAVEIYNPTGAEVDLTGYSLKYHFNGSASAGLTINLTGAVAAGDVFVVAQSSASATIIAQADQTNGAGWFNGDDAVALVHGDTAVDVVGQIGFDPGDEWGSGDLSTADNTLRRNADVCVGDTVGGDAFDPSVQWTGFPNGAFDGLGVHTADCGDVPPPAASVVINEFSASTTGTDVEYLELLASPADTDLSGYTVLELEGDLNTTTPVFGTVDEVLTAPAADASGRALIDLPAGALENGTISLLLITGTAPAAGSDVDANDDGVIDDGLGFTVVDSVAVNDGVAGAITYGNVVLTEAYDGLDFAPGGASRIPDGVDTDTAADWMRNDFNLAGIGDTVGSPVTGEALNTPGAENEEYVAPPVEPELQKIGAVQGAGDASPFAGLPVIVEGTVVADFQQGGFDGFYVQDAGDGDTATSDGVFVFGGGGVEVAVGDAVSVTGVVSEYFGLTEITASAVTVTATGVALPAPVELTLPATEAEREALEGMYVTLPQTLTVGETFEFARYGIITLTDGRQYQPTHVYDAGTDEAKALAAANIEGSIGVDDGRGIQNPDPALHPNGEEFTLQNTFRSGDFFTGVTGVLDYRFELWSVQRTEPAEYEVGNPRPVEVPDVGGELTVASFNVLNYFTTLTGSDARGANNPEEFERQEAKIVAALAEIDADVFGLMEIENNGTALETLTAALNEYLGDDVYDYVETGPIGTDVIATAIMYKPASVTPVGEFQLMDQSKDPRWLDDLNRPGLTQTFADAAGATFSVVVNHLKSKGSACDAVGDPIDPDGQGNCNGVRTDAAAALADWLATDPTDQGAGRTIIMGDLNAYASEDPIQALEAAGYTDLLEQFQGGDAYSYVFDGQSGYLDHALAGADIVDEVTGAATWNINADESNLIDYDTSFKQDAQDAIYAPDPYRSSDHDPVILGLSLTAPDTVPPTIDVTADPAYIHAPNNKTVDVSFEVETADDRDGEVTVELTDVAINDVKRAEWSQTGDTTGTVVATNGAVYTFTWTATDEAGNTATDTTVVVVGMKGLKNLL